MSITFACGQCSKTFTVDDKSGGKKGRCKDCGALMIIPRNASAMISTETAPAKKKVVAAQRATNAGPGATLTPARDETSTARRATMTSPTPVAAPRRPSNPAPAPPPKVDLYGMDDAPLPPRAPLGWNDEDDDDSGPIVTSGRGKKKRRSTGSTWGSGGSSSRDHAADGLHLLFRAAVVLVPLVGFCLLIPWLKTTFLPGWAGQSEIESLVRQEIDLMNELTAIFRTVQDVQSASAASSKANETINKLEKLLSENKDRIGAQKDIDAMKQKYQQEEEASGRSFAGEAARVRTIPGAFEALAIMPALMRLDAILRTLPGKQANNPGFNQPPASPPPPTFTPPPNFNNNQNRNPPTSRPGTRGFRGPR